MATPRNNSSGSTPPDLAMELDRLNLPAAPSVQSPTLAAIAVERRPHPGTVCETCPHAMWMASGKDVKAYCRVMFVVAWSTAEPRALTHCDGPFIDQEEDKDKAEM